MNPQKMDRIVVGASAGGVEVLIKLVTSLPRDLPAAALVTMHMPPTHKSLMPEIINRCGTLKAHQARDGMEINNGNVYFSAPGLHLTVNDDHVKLIAGPKINGFRPAIDALFASAAEAYGPRLIGIVLSGLLDDGTQGLIRIKERGGISIAQDPEEALYGDMPRSAINWDHVDYVQPVSGIADTLVKLTKGIPVEYDKRKTMERWQRAQKRSLSK